MRVGGNRGAFGEVEVHVRVAGEDDSDLAVAGGVARLDARGDEPGKLEREVLFEDVARDAGGVVAGAFVVLGVRAGVMRTAVPGIDDDDAGELGASIQRDESNRAEDDEQNAEQAAQTAGRSKILMPLRGTP